MGCELLQSPAQEKDMALPWIFVLLMLCLSASVCFCLLRSASVLNHIRSGQLLREPAVQISTQTTVGDS